MCPTGGPSVPALQHPCLHSCQALMCSRAAGSASEPHPGGWLARAGAVGDLRLVYLASYRLWCRTTAGTSLMAPGRLAASAPCAAPEACFHVVECLLSFLSPRGRPRSHPLAVAGARRPTDADAVLDAIPTHGALREMYSKAHHWNPFQGTSLEPLPPDFPPRRRGI